MRRLSVAVAVAVVALGGAVGAGASGSRSGALVDGHWRATLHYQSALDTVFPRVSHLRLRVTRDGKTVFDRAVPLPRDCKTDGCSLLSGPGGRSFELRDLGLARGPAAVIWFWTGGAHCCTVVHVVSMPGGRTAVRNFGDPGATIVELRGHYLFRSADDRFAYLFTSFAASAFPVQLWRFDGSRLTNVTRQYPATIAADAGKLWRGVLSERASRGEVRGVFAAWAADQCLLGKQAVVANELAAGVARGTFSPPRGEPGGFAGARYAEALRLHLRQWGYCR
jgi:hypothetical protein